MMISRRTGLAMIGSSGVGLAFGGAQPAWAAASTIRVGYQKYGTFLLLKARGLLEQKLTPQHVAVSWFEFPGGPQMLEALNAGAIDFAITGEAPPIFAQAAQAPLVYIANEPAAPLSEALLVPKASPITDVAQLQGKRVALNKGSNVHYLVVKLLERAGVAYADIKPVFLTPADGRAAFEQGAVDAWAIWDPFLAAAEIATEARTLANGTDLVANRQFYLATRAFADENPAIVDTVVQSIQEIDGWAKDNVHNTAKDLSASVGIPVPILERALSRQAWDAQPITAAVLADQQRIADTFYSIGLIPKPIVVTDAVRSKA